MSDTRLTLAGVALVFAGVVVLGAFGGAFFDASVEAEEFGDCHEYFEDRPPEEVPCGAAAQQKAAFFALVLGLFGAGVLALAMGARGGWDQKARPEDMLGPGGGGGPGEGGGPGGGGGPGEGGGPGAGG